MSPCPLFTPETTRYVSCNYPGIVVCDLVLDVILADRKVKKAQQLWNTRNPEKIALAYTEGTHVASTQLVELMIAIGLSDSIRRNRDQFLRARGDHSVPY